MRWLVAVTPLSSPPARPSQAHGLTGSQHPRLNRAWRAWLPGKQRLQRRRQLLASRRACPDPSPVKLHYAPGRISRGPRRVDPNRARAVSFVPTQQEAVCFWSLTREPTRLVGSRAGAKQNDFTSRSRGMALPTPGFHLSDAGQLSTTRLAAQPHVQ